MWKWRIVNIYWLLLLAFIAWCMFSSDSEMRLSGIHANIAGIIVLLSVFTLIFQIQFAWHMWLWGKKQDEKNKH